MNTNLAKLTRALDWEARKRQRPKRLHTPRTQGSREPPRVTRRLHPLGGWSDARATTSGEVSGRAAWACGADGVRVRTPCELAVGRDLLGGREAGRDGRDGAEMGAPG